MSKKDITEIKSVGRIIPFEFKENHGIHCHCGTKLIQIESEYSYEDGTDAICLKCPECNPDE